MNPLKTRLANCMFAMQLTYCKDHEIKDVLLLFVELYELSGLLPCLLSYVTCLAYCHVC